ncbi:NHLP leader peptide domain protein [Thiorhodovibrio winogradskyi]|uniref:NHLP leader peptide domain protein n=1 Tax=Thiorhodovibrio winogradskyi TaxID=77007 RepID=A0ABZ0S7V8_9GAMM
MTHIFNERLLADPAGTLAVEGMPVPEGLILRLLEDSAREPRLVIPDRPKDIRGDTLVDVAGGRINLHIKKILKHCLGVFYHCISTIRTWHHFQ